MKSIGRLFQVAVIFLLANGFAAAQNPADGPKSEPIPNKHIKVKYNKSKNLTTVTLKTLALSNSMNREFSRESEFGQLDLDASFTHPGEQLEKPAEAMTLTFKGTQKNQLWQARQTVAAIVDEQTALVLGQSTYSSNSQTFYFEELMSVTVPYEAMKKIGAAKTLRFQLGTRFVSIKGEQLEDLRALVARMSP